MEKIEHLSNSLGIFTNTNIQVFNEYNLVVNYENFIVIKKLNLTKKNINKISDLLLKKQNKIILFDKISKYHIRYICFRSNMENIFFIIGPFLIKDPYYEAHSELYNLKKNNVDEYDFYHNLKKVTVTPTKSFLSIVQTLINSDFIEINYDPIVFQEIIEEEVKPQKQVTLSLENIELTNKRYFYENEKLKYIKLGNYEKAIKYSKLFASLSEIEQRIPNNIFRSLKNGLFISSGIIRKSIEELDIPPTLIHNISSKFFTIIEQCSTINELKNLESQMIKEYSLLCFFHNKKYTKFNPKIKTVLLYIDLNIKNNVSLSEASEFINLNIEYFSRLFKKEVGINFKDYTKNLKINIAKDYITNSSLKTSEIAFKLGYSSVNSFSKFFKKNTGLTPIEFKLKNKNSKVLMETLSYFI